MDSASMAMSGVKKQGGNSEVLPPVNPTSMGGNSADYVSKSVGGKKGSRAMKMKMAKLRAMRKTRGGSNHGEPDKINGGEDAPRPPISGGAIESSPYNSAYSGDVKAHMPTNPHTMKGGKKRKGSKKGSRKASRKRK
jgi:hypothetical protein